MKRALLPLAAAAVLTLAAACGNGDSTESAPTATGGAEPTTTETTEVEPTETGDGTETTDGGETTGSTAGGATFAEINEQARTACEDGVVSQAAGATFENPGSLRAASDAAGRVITITGTADVGGTATPYTCQVVAGPDGVELQEAVVG